ncbi:hypothetical protein GN244_ATG16990 [Phytophthora infestans]|uniref:Uncharacterized protein n=1 Tax=Phytophthora infestans TaxID=4787 RepID=A0A833SAY9_PHYIN|nr:hypothetical protein GN244_ATG16990 [Phytophthora infestans]
MHALLNHIAEKVKCNKDAHARAMSVFHNRFEFIELFLNHRLRVVQQHRALSKLLDNTSARAAQGGTLNEAVVTIDFKMKIDHICHRKKHGNIMVSVE